MARCTFVDGIVSVHGAIDSVKEGKQNGYRLVVRRHDYGEEKNYNEDGHKWHELYYYHLHEGAWAEGATRNREKIKAAQRTAHDIEKAALHPEDVSAEMAAEGACWKTRYELYRQSPQYTEKPYHFYNFIYVTILHEVQEHLILAGQR